MWFLLRHHCHQHCNHYRHLCDAYAKGDQSFKWHQIYVSQWYLSMRNLNIFTFEQEKDHDDELMTMTMRMMMWTTMVICWSVGKIPTSSSCSNSSGVLVLGPPALLLQHYPLLPLLLLLPPVVDPDSKTMHPFWIVPSTKMPNNTWFKMSPPLNCLPKSRSNMVMTPLDYPCWPTQWNNHPCWTHSKMSLQPKCPTKPNMSPPNASRSMTLGPW